MRKLLLLFGCLLAAAVNLSAETPKVSIAATSLTGTPTTFEWKMYLMQEDASSYVYHFQCNDNQVVNVGTGLWIVVNDGSAEERAYGVHANDNPVILDVEFDLEHSPVAHPFCFDESWSGEAYVRVNKDDPASCIAFFTNEKQPVAYLPLIEQGKVWEYVGVYYRPVENYTEGGIVHHFTKFDGTVTVNGKEYSKFKLYRSDYYRGAEVYGELEFADSKAQDRTLGFLREEGKKIYQLTKDDYLYFDIPSEAPLEGNIESEEFGEFLVYDFSLEDGDKFYLLPIGSIDPSLIIPVTVELDTPTIVADFPRVTYSYCPDSTAEGSIPALPYGGKVIEGIGPTEDGNVSGFGPSMMPQTPNNVNSPGRGSSLVRVYSPDGQIIYGDEPNSVQIVTSDKIENSTTYDIMGRVVKETVPGSIYIRSGKKFVAK